MKSVEKDVIRRKIASATEISCFAIILGQFQHNINEFELFKKMKFHQINLRKMLSDAKFQLQVRYGFLKSVLGIFSSVKISINFLKIKN